MTDRRKRGWGFVVILVVSLSVITAAAVSGYSLMPDPKGSITLLAPCDKEAIAGDVTEMLRQMRTVLLKSDFDVIFATAAKVASDKDGTVFVLTLKVSQSGVAVSSASTQVIVDSGKTVTCVATTGVMPATGKYDVKAEVSVKDTTIPLDSKECSFTAPTK